MITDAICDIPIIYRQLFGIVVGLFAIWFTLYMMKGGNDEHGNSKAR